MARWVCPHCEREFGRARQAHVCVPGGTVDATFAGKPAGQRAAYDVIVAHVATLGPVHADAVGVGVFLKRGRTLAELRPKARALSLSLILPRRVDDARVARTIDLPGGRVVHFVKLRDAGDVDDRILDWVTEAYLAAGS